MIWGGSAHGPPTENGDEPAADPEGSPQDVEHQQNLMHAVSTSMFSKRLTGDRPRGAITANPLPQMISRTVLIASAIRHLVSVSTPKRWRSP